eukprot:TRINITY_DN848_c0_g1_i10.p1 TRINITY_DN848_c0_g1~~TRINITY_DN848_c0_g1_i10.p1  ORF type:complete len:178 (+),score=54.02 TRINITY_DN848_c0_g1_i10:306-839(+)
MARIVGTKANDKGNHIYLLNDNTGSIHITDYNSIVPSSLLNTRKYTAVHCVIGKGHTLSLEAIFEVRDSNEVTNHWLNVITGKCIRRYGALSDEELRAAEEAEVSESIERRQDLDPVEKTVLEVIEKMKRSKLELSCEEIFDQMEDCGDLPGFEKRLRGMVQKGILRLESGNHYNTY